MSQESRNNKLDIQVEGLKELRKALKTLEGEGKDSLKAEIKATNKAAADIVAASARLGVPVKSGRLRDSIRTSGTIRAGVVRAGKSKVPYAAPIHFGWPKRHIAPKPFLYEARDKRAGEVVELYVQRVEKLLEEVIPNG